MTPDETGIGAVRVGPKAWIALAVISLAALMAYMDRMVFSQLLEPVRAELGLSDMQAGLMLGTGFAISYAFSGLLSGILADRFNRRGLMAGGVVVWSAATFMLAFATSLPGVVAGRLMVGFGEAALFPAAISLLADLFPAARRGMATSVLFSTAAAGTGIASIVGSALLELFQHLGPHNPLMLGLTPWRETVAVMGLAGVFVAALFALVEEPIRGAMDAPPLGDSDADPQAPWTLIIVAIASLTLWVMADYGIQTWAPALLSRQFAATPHDIATRFGPIALTSLVIAPFIGGALADFAVRRGWGAGKILVAAFGLSAGPFTLAMTMAPTMTAALSFYAAYNIVVGAASTAGLSAVQDLSPARLRGRVIASQVFLYSAVGFALGPLGVGAVSDHLAAGPRALGRAILIIGLAALTPSALLMWSAVLIKLRQDRLDSLIA